MTSHDSTATSKSNANKSTHCSSNGAETTALASMDSGNEAAIHESHRTKDSEASSTQPNPRLQALLAKKENLESTLATLEAQRAELVAQATLSPDIDMSADWAEENKTKAALASANGVIKDHIALLQKYNEMKDIGQGLMGLIAEERNVRVRAVMEEFGMDDKD